MCLYFKVVYHLLQLYSYFFHVSQLKKKISSATSALKSMFNKEEPQQDDAVSIEVAILVFLLCYCLALNNVFTVLLMTYFT